MHRAPAARRRRLQRPRHERHHPTRPSPRARWFRPAHAHEIGVDEDRPAIEEAIGADHTTGPHNPSTTAGPLTTRHPPAPTGCLQIRQHPRSPPSTPAAGAGHPAARLPAASRLGGRHLPAPDPSRPTRPRGGHIAPGGAPRRRPGAARRRIPGRGTGGVLHHRLVAFAARGDLRPGRRTPGNVRADGRRGRRRFPGRSSRADGAGALADPQRPGHDARLRIAPPLGLRGAGPSAAPVGRGRRYRRTPFPASR